MLQNVVDMLHRFKNRDQGSEGVEVSTGTFKKNNAETVWLEVRCDANDKSAVYSTVRRVSGETTCGKFPVCPARQRRKWLCRGGCR